MILLLWPDRIRCTGHFFKGYAVVSPFIMAQYFHNLRKSIAMKNTAPMRDQQDVKRSNDKHIDEDFNNYPNAPAKEGQLGKANRDKQELKQDDAIQGNEAVPMKNEADGKDTEEEEGYIAANNETKEQQDSRFLYGYNGTRKEDATDKNNDQQPANEDVNDADLTEDDFIALGDKDKDMDLGEDEIDRDGSARAFEATEGLEETVSDLDDDTLERHVSETGTDLDVPGSEDDDDNEDIGEEDEENNYYSLSGDNKF
jgi:hypothetical protein